MFNFVHVALTGRPFYQVQSECLAVKAYSAMLYICIYIYL